MAMYNVVDFPPTVEMGHFFSVVTGQGTEKFYECVYVEPLPKSQDLVQDFGSISAGSTDSSNKISILEVEGSAKTETDLSEIFQVRMQILDDCQLLIKEPAAQSRFKTRNDEVKVDMYTPPEMTEVYVFEDDTLSIDVTNPTQYTQTVNRVIFWGWRIIGRQLAGKPEKYSRLIATGFSR